MAQELKVDIVWEIAAMIGIEAPHMSTGSTEPREIFDAIDQALGLGLQRERRLTKPQMARGIVEAAGFEWSSSDESRGGTVTLDGLRRVRGAVLLLTGSTT
ncbi:hypothetical protein [Aeromicrobium sp. Leaf245]|uniref:hypothetical protein n=1 Tax=Aeromicrobium sp. Leaf245 TaxID=1736306 RepID=UPI0006FBD709|nr:hypothetical protein [Aeromicrobium sp. Leaf245]KQO38894.1 hypothetical protein ASF05_03165 [Aeromicrobium sp. Leaf245]